MTPVQWDSRVPTKILRQTTWARQNSVIADETRAGTRKVRAGNFVQPKTYTVVMHMTNEEREYFESWYERGLRYGAYPFYFRDILNHGIERAYRFAPDTSINFGNPSGNIVEVQMTWEEV